MVSVKGGKWKRALNSWKSICIYCCRCQKQLLLMPLLHMKHAYPLKTVDLYCESPASLSGPELSTVPAVCLKITVVFSSSLWKLLRMKQTREALQLYSETAKHSNTVVGGVQTIGFRQSRRLLGHIRSSCRTLEEDQLPTNHTHCGNHTAPMPALKEKPGLKVMNKLNANTPACFSSKIFVCVCVQYTSTEKYMYVRKKEPEHKSYVYTLECLV